MFVRKKHNTSGSVSVQIIDKSEGKYKVVQTIGSSKDPDEIEKLYTKAYYRIPEILKQRSFDFLEAEDQATINALEGLNNLNIHVLGPEFIFGTLFDRIGFNRIKNELFRHLVITRLVYPGSKLKTIDYLQRYKGIRIDKHKIYRFLDTFYNTHKNTAEQIAFEYTKHVLGNCISVVFYDLTTLYFEAEDEDDLRIIGFNKDGKFQKPQIFLGLTVGRYGYPISYDVFRGNTYEGHTLLPALDKIQKKYDLGKPIVIADAALLSADNLEILAKNGYRYIIGARIKSEKKEIKAEILEQAKGIKDGDSFVIKKPDGVRLVVTYSDKRARKDAHNRERGIRRLHKRIKTGKLTKEAINNRGYNKFLTLTGKVIITIDEDKIRADQKWDGLKGYMTNTRLSSKTIAENYGHLWQIEKAFRISKTDLKVRPIFHYRQRRIEAHICIAFVAYTIYKELERLLYKCNAPFSAQRAIELTQNMYEVSCTLPKSQKEVSRILEMSNEQNILWKIIRNS